MKMHGIGMDRLMEAWKDARSKFARKQKEYLEDEVMGEQIAGAVSGTFNQCQYLCSHIERIAMTEVWREEMEELYGDDDID